MCFINGHYKSRTLASGDFTNSGRRFLASRKHLYSLSCRPIVGHTPRKLPAKCSNLPFHRIVRPYRRSNIIQLFDGIVKHFFQFFSKFFLSYFFFRFCSFHTDFRKFPAISRCKHSYNKHHRHRADASRNITADINSFDIVN